MAAPRLAMLDVDGTLRHGTRWRRGSEELLRELTQMSIPIALCSGRHVESLEKLAKDLPGVQWLSGSGGSAISRRTAAGWETIAQRPLPTAVVDAVVQTTVAMGIEAWVYTTTSVIVSAWTTAVEREVELTGVSPKVGRLCGRNDVVKVLVLVSDKNSTADVRRVGSVSGCRVVESSPGYLDVILAESADTKGGDHLTASLGIGWKDIVAVGDGENDIGMLTRAGSAVCMAPLAASALDAALKGQVRREASTLEEVMTFVRQLVGG